METTEQILYNVTKPYQYIGKEVLSTEKDWENVDVKIALAFPDKYEVGASNLGQRILYSIINEQKNFYADRAYAPDVDFKEELIKNDLPLYGLNSHKGLSEFDFVGFSLQYELAYPTVLKMLELSKIPIKRSERDESHPIIAAGGPCTFNPVPMADFVDIFLIGDGEELLIELLSKYNELKKQKLSRKNILKELAQIKGVFAPEFYDYTKVPVKRLVNDVPEKIEKRVVNIAELNAPTSYPVAYSTSIHDRAIVEIRRGCGRMCRFCQPGHVTLPVRERKAKDIIKATQELVKNTGYDEYSLLSLSSNDYTNIESVIEELGCGFAQKGISASLPSQRVDKFSVKLANLVQEIRKSTLTLAPEAGSQRLRDVINKNLTKEQIIDAALQAYQNGFHQLKFYFIVGLPTETYEDLDELAALLAEIKEKANALKKDNNIPQSLNINCTLSIFVPKPFTPLQWHSQPSPEEIMEKIYYLKDKTKNLKGIRLKYHDKAVSQIEAVFSRGGYELNTYIYNLYKNASYLDAWDENFSYSLWTETATQSGISLNELAEKQYKTDEALSWEIVDVGINKQWLVNEYEKALASKASVPCEQKCTNCDVCPNLATKKVIDEPYTSQLTKSTKTDETTYKYRLKLSKTGHLKYLSHLDWQNTILKALYKSDLKLAFSQGFNPIPKISLGVALPLFVESECEFVDIELYDDLQVNALKEILQAQLPKNALIKSVQHLENGALSIDTTTQWAEYEFIQLQKNSDSPLPKKEDLLYIIDKVSSDESIYIKKKNKKGIEKNINIKDSIKSAKVLDDASGSQAKFSVILKIGQNADIPSIRPDTFINHFYPSTLFKIKKIRMLDFNLKEL